MKIFFCGIALFMLSSPVAAQAQNAEALIKKHACVACHSVDKAIVGPAYKDVAKKYAGQKDVEKTLAEKVKKGGSGVWGKIAMPPNVGVPDADIQTMVKWILTLK